MSTQCLIQLDLLVQVTGITPGRAAALIPGALGLISVIIGRWAVARTTGGIKRKAGAIISLLISIIGLFLSGIHLMRTVGNSFGTGSGRLGAIVAFVLCITGIILGCIALVRLKKISMLDKEKS